MNNFKENRMFWSNLTYFIVLFLFTCLRLSNSLGLLDFIPSEFRDNIFTILTQIFILFLVPMTMYLFIFKQKPKDIFKNFMFKKIGAKNVIYCFLLGITIYFIILFASTFFNTWLEVFGYEKTIYYSTGEKTYSSFVEFLLGVLFVAVLPGFFEEFSNRGMLLSGLNKGSKIRAVMLSGLLFGLMHLNINQFFYATISGILMATVVMVTKSIWPSIIVHFTNNALNTYFQYATDNNLFGSKLFDYINLTITDISPMFKFLIYILFIVFILYACVWLIAKIFFNQKQRQYNKFVKEFSQLKEQGKQIDMDNYNELVEFYLLAEKYGKDRFPFLKKFSDLKNEENNSENSTNDIQKNYPAKQKTDIKLLYNLMFQNKNEIYKPTFKENFFLYCSIFLGTVVTIFTFIWGLL